MTANVDDWKSKLESKPESKLESKPESKPEVQTEVQTGSPNPGVLLERGGEFTVL